AELGDLLGNAHGGAAGQTAAVGVGGQAGGGPAGQAEALPPPADGEVGVPVVLQPCPQLVDDGRGVVRTGLRYRRHAHLLVTVVKLTTSGREPASPGAPRPLQPPSNAAVRAEPNNSDFDGCTHLAGGFWEMGRALRRVLAALVATAAIGGPLAYAAQPSGADILPPVSDTRLTLQVAQATLTSSGATAITWQGAATINPAKDTLIR